MTVREQALAEARARRQALLSTVSDLRRQLRPVPLAEDALRLLDPKLSVLARLRKRVGRNKLLSLAVLAGASWLAGFARHRDSKDPAAATRARVKPKEKKDDSGQQQRQRQSDPGRGRQRRPPRPKAGAQAFRWRGEAGPEGSRLAALFIVEPRQHAGGTGAGAQPLNTRARQVELQL